MGTGERRRREREQRYGEIVEAAKRVFFTKGFDNTTMDDIAQESELSKGTLYLYFKNKEDLAHGIMFESFTMLKKMMGETIAGGENGLEKIRRIAAVIPEYYVKQTDYFDFARNIDYKITATAGESTMNRSPAQSAITASAISCTVCRDMTLPHFQQVVTPIRAKRRRR